MKEYSSFFFRIVFLERALGLHGNGSIRICHRRVRSRRVKEANYAKKISCTRRWSEILAHLTVRFRNKSMISLPPHEPVNYQPRRSRAPSSDERMHHGHGRSFHGSCARRFLSTAAHDSDATGSEGRDGFNANIPRRSNAPVRLKSDLRLPWKRGYRQRRASGRRTSL